MPSYLNTEPELGEGESILRRYPAEVYLIEDRSSDGDDVSVRFHAPAREQVTFENEDRALLFADLYTALDGFRISGTGDRGVPLNVATSGNSAIAAYMYAAWGSSPTQIAQSIDTDRQTVLGYFEAIRNRAEDVIEAWDESQTPAGELG